MTSPGRLLRRALPGWTRQPLLRARLRARGVRVRFGPGARVDSEAQFRDMAQLAAGASVFGCRVGRWTYFGEGCLAIYSDIGSFCSIAPHAVIGGGTHPAGGHVTTSPLFYGTVHNPWGTFEGSMSRDEELPKTSVGSDVWIGYGAIVMPGVHVGDGAIIGAGAVVTRDIDPYAIVAGVPARTLRHRFTPEEVQWLLGLRWWDWPDDRLRALRPRFSNLESLRAALGAPEEALAP